VAGLGREVHCIPRETPSLIFRYIGNLQLLPYLDGVWNCPFP